MRACKRMDIMTTEIVMMRVFLLTSYLFVCVRMADISQCTKARLVSGKLDCWRLIIGFEILTDGSVWKEHHRHGYQYAYFHGLMLF